MTQRRMREMLRELVKDLRVSMKDVDNRLKYGDPHMCHPQYLAGLSGGMKISIDRIISKFGMRI